VQLYDNCAQLAHKYNIASHINNINKINELPSFHSTLLRCFISIICIIIKINYIKEKSSK